jgi:hypothetical protein
MAGSIDSRNFHLDNFVLLTDLKWVVRACACVCMRVHPAADTEVRELCHIRVKPDTMHGSRSVNHLYSDSGKTES